MASRKATKRQSGQKQDAVTAGNIKSPAAQMMPAQSAALDVFAYPHLLSHILDNTNTPTLATLLRCSKGMLKTVSPRLYRKLHLTPLQLKAMLETGWAARGSSAFSASLFHCLQHTRTLHLEAYHHGVAYPKIPRGLFADCTRVVLHIDEPPSGSIYTFPSLFQSLGSHLYIQLSDDAVLQHEFEQGQALALLRGLPRSFTAVTFLVPHAYRFKSAPSCGYIGTPPAHKPTITIVLLPWSVSSGLTPLQKDFGYHWIESAQSGTLVTGHDRVGEYIGIENTGRLGMEELLLVLQPGANGEVAPLPNVTSIVQWLAAIGDDTIYSDLERDVLILMQYELGQEVGLESLRMVRGIIELLSSLTQPSAEQVTLLARAKVNEEKHIAALAQEKTFIAEMKECFTRNKSLGIYD